MNVSILVPRRADFGRRDELWRFVRARWAEEFPSWPIFEGQHERGPFNRSAAVNAAAALAGSFDVALVIDSDVLPDPVAVRHAVELASTGRPAIGFSRRLHLTRYGSDRLLDGFSGSWEGFVQSELSESVSGAYAVPRAIWDRIGGFDEAFSGWGCEDVAFDAAVRLVGGTVERCSGDLWHLWHPRSPERDKTSELFLANRRRRERYEEALEAQDLGALDRLLEEGSAVVHPRPAPAPSTIPRIIHRTMAENTDPEVARFGRLARELNPGWLLLDHVDPLDPSEWPETGDLWHLCRSGAQKAGLIRLEALHRYGGIYLDSDVEPLRSFESLTSLEGFAGWEDERTVPDAVLGFRPGHPALSIMLARARSSIEAGGGAWASGPGVSTEVLPGRPDVLLFPPGTFYPYHYREKHRASEDHAGGNPWALAVHHWRHSWKGN